VFDILSKEYDIKLADQYLGMKQTLQTSFKLLKAISRGNSVVQARLYDRLDFLLKVKGAEPEMAEAVTEVSYCVFHLFTIIQLTETIPSTI